MGPACSKIIRALAKVGPLKTNILEPEQSTAAELTYSEGDKKAILASWMGARSSGENTQVMHFTEVDRQLRLEPGTAKRYLSEIATRWRYVVDQQGEHTILFKPAPLQRRLTPARF